MDEASKVFDQLDVAGQGFLSLEELSQSLHLSRVEIRELLIQIKTNLYSQAPVEADLKLTKSEFIHIMQPKNVDLAEIPRDVISRYRAAFDSIDTFKLGTITPFMLARALGDSMPSHIFTGKRHMTFEQVSLRFPILFSEIFSFQFARLLCRAEQQRPAKMILDAIEDTHGRRFAFALRASQHEVEQVGPSIRRILFDLMSLFSHQKSKISFWGALNLSLSPAPEPILKTSRTAMVGQREGQQTAITCVWQARLLDSESQQQI